jgi:hypothetical protein
MRAVLLALLLAGASTSLVADDWSKTWNVSGSPEMRVDAGDGAVVMTSSNTGQIEAHIITTGWTIGPGQITITERQDGNRVELDIKIPKVHMSWGNRKINVELRVPPGTWSFVRTGDGAIQLHGIRGIMDVRTGDGSIEATDVDGKLSAHTGDGTVHVRGRVDGFDVETGDGNIEAELAPGSNIGSGWRVRTGDGHVTIRVPQDLRANLDAHTGDGSITVDMPIAMEGLIKQSHDVHGKINGGGEPLTVHTGDGSIHIERS